MNAITRAFRKAALYQSFAKEDKIAVARMAEQQPKFKEGWNLSASFKTYQQLKHQGVVK